MKKQKLSTIVGLSLFAIAIGVFAPSTLAAAITTSGGQALEIAPPVINLSANPGQTVTTQISLRDVSSGKLIVTGEINDFVANGEDGTPKVILDQSISTPYSLKDWISPLPELSLAPKQIKNLPITITVPDNAAPGGYYGIVRFTGNAPELKGQGVSLSASLGALILLKVNGVAKENLSIQEFSVNKGDEKSNSLFESTPLEFKVRLKNNGNIHEQPVGQIAITDMFGKKVAALNVNLATNNILPQSIRDFKQKLDSSVIGNKVLFGRYQAVLHVTYGSTKQVLAQTITFWVIPYTIIIAIIIAMVGGFIGLKYLIKRYNKFIIGKAQQPKSKLK